MNYELEEIDCTCTSCILFHQNADAFRPQKPFKADISFSAAFIAESNVLRDRFMGGYLSYDDFYRGYSPDVEHLYAEYLQLPAAADGDPMFSLRADFKVLEWLCVGVDFHISTFGAQSIRDSTDIRNGR